MHLNADVIFDANAGRLFQMMNNVLGVPESTMHVHIALGKTNNWTHPLVLDDFMVEGIFPDTTSTITQGVQVSSLSVQISGTRQVVDDPNATTTTTCCEDHERKGM